MSKHTTHKQAAFISNILSGMNGTEAAIKAYNAKNRGTAAVIASENLKKTIIAERIRIISEENGLSVQKALEAVVEALHAVKIGHNGEEPDHKVRLEASNICLKLLGVVCH
ncbi:MAG: terminase small subunit [Candidatus Saccharimonadales bacterium]